MNLPFAVDEDELELRQKSLIFGLDEIHETLGTLVDLAKIGD